MTWIICIGYALLMVQSVRIMLGVFYEDDMIEDGFDLTMGIVLATIFSIILAWFIVPARLVYFLIKRYPITSPDFNPGDFIERFAVKTEVLSREEVRQNKEREREREVRELRAQVAEMKRSVS